MTHELITEQYIKLARRFNIYKCRERLNGAFGDIKEVLSFRGRG